MGNRLMRSIGFPLDYLRPASRRQTLYEPDERALAR
jgi:hypothetical protein